MTVRRTAQVSIMPYYLVHMLFTFEELLFQFSFCDLNLDSLVHLLLMSPFVVCVVLDCGGE